MIVRKYKNIYIYKAYITYIQSIYNILDKSIFILNIKNIHIHHKQYLLGSFSHY